MCSTNLILFSAICVLLYAVTCTKINPDTYGEGICQYPDCAPQLPPPSTYQPYASPPPPTPTSPPTPPPPAPTLPPPPAPTGYAPYGVTPPPPAGYPDNYPPPPAAPEYHDQQPADSLPSPPPSLYTYLNDTSTSAASTPALPSVFNLCSVICTAVVYIWFLSAALLYA